MSRIIYLAELYSRLGWEPILSTTPNNFDREDNIYYFDTSQNETSYWVTTWSGYFDTPETTNVQILFEQFLIQVYSEAALLLTVGTFYVSGDLIYINLDRKPWQYSKQLSEVNSIEDGTFSSAPKDENNLSDNIINGLSYKTILDIPSFKNKIPDAISGISLGQTFNYSLNNADGFFDDTEDSSYFNTVTTIRKTNIENPVYSDFNIIKRGVVDNTKISFSKFDVTAIDYNRSFTNEVCNVFSVDNYPNLPDENLNRKIPILYNTGYKIQLFQVDKDTSSTPLWIDYVAIEPTWLYSVSGVYDTDGNGLTFSVSSGIIRVTSLDDTGEVIEAYTADIEGKQNYSIGDIVTELINDKSFLKYISENWDTTETDAYKSSSYDVGFYWSGGQLKNAINAVLKNDVAYLITKNDGRLTIRRWGTDYTTHNLDSWAITNEPSKNFNNSSKYYITSANINYNKIQENELYQNIYLNDSKKNSIFDKYRKFQIGNYDTEILNESDAIDLSNLLLSRFGGMKEYVDVSTSQDTSEINLLDKIEIAIEINDRTFSQAYRWIVTEINPSQDQIGIQRIWEDTGLLTFDGDNATLDDLLFLTEENF